MESLALQQQFHQIRINYNYRKNATTHLGNLTQRNSLSLGMQAVSTTKHSMQALLVNSDHHVTCDVSLCMVTTVDLGGSKLTSQTLFLVEQSPLDIFQFC